MAVSVTTRVPSYAVAIALKNGQQITADQLQDNIIEIQTNRRLGDSGSWQITMPFRPPPADVLASASIVNAYGPYQGPLSWADVISPMDHVTIALFSPAGGEIVMRGFVDNVGESVSDESGTPVRRVVIVGRDYTKLLLQSRLYFLEGLTQLDIMTRFNNGAAKLNQQSGGTSPPTVTPDKTGASVQMTGLTSEDIMSILTTEFFESQIQDMIQGFAPALLAPNISTPGGVLLLDGISDDPLNADLQTFNPVVYPENSEPFIHLKDLYDNYQHNPWRELYFDDIGLNSYLIYRPTPWLDMDGNFVQLPDTAVLQSLPAPHEIDDAVLITVSLGRNDAQVANFIATYSAIFQGLTEALKTIGSKLESFSTSTNPAIIKIGDNSAPSSYLQYGFRLLEIHTPYFDISEGLTDEQHASQITKISQIAASWNQRLVDAYGHAELLETGSITIKGDSSIHIGHYITLTGRTAARFYVEGVTHIFRVPVEAGQVSGSGSFTTALDLTRGRGFLVKKGFNP